MKPKYYFLLILFLFNCQTKTIPPPDGLMVDLLRAPEQAVITDPQPEFSWIFPITAQKQSAWQILVASKPELLSENDADLWNSGQQNNNQSTNVIYMGNPLVSNQSYWWKVKVWSNDGESDFSKPQQFRTGNFDRSHTEWPGQSDWIELAGQDWVAEDRQMADFQVIKPVELTESHPGQWFADFGKAAFGTLKFTIKAREENQQLTLFLGEKKHQDQTVFKNTGRSNIALHETNLILKAGTHEYHLEIPRHVGRYPHSQKLAPFYPEVVPFRYVEMKSEKPFEVTDLQQLALFYYFDDEAASFRSNSEQLNQVWDLCKYTLKATPFLGVYCDGNRERMPYEADAYIQQLGHYAVDREYSAARYTIKFLLSHASWPTEWQMHAIMMAYQHWMYTGDIELITETYDHLKQKTLIDLAREDGLISTRTGKATPELLASLNFNGNALRDIVDWPAGTPEGEEQIAMAGPTPEGERDGYVFTDYNTVVNAFHYYVLELMSDLAAAIGNGADHDFYQQRAQLVRQSLIDNFFDPERGLFTDGIDTDHASLHANMFPVAFGIIPEGHQNTLSTFMKSQGMACSVYGAQYLLEALYRLQEADYALSLMTAEHKRSWLNMIRSGSTMTTEAWDEYYKPNLTWNHAWGSAPANIIPRHMLGIQPLTPGFSKFQVKPQIGTLDEISLKVPTVKGFIGCEIKSSEASMEMVLIVPGNTEAVVIMPPGYSKYQVSGDHQELRDYSEPEITLASGKYLLKAF